MMFTHVYAQSRRPQVPYVERCLAGGPVKTLQGERQGLVMMPCLHLGLISR